MIDELNSLQLLVLRCPPQLLEAVGCHTARRFVALYWTPFGDEVCWTDGEVTATGSWHPFLVFLHHPRAAAHLDHFDFGSSESEATHWLLVDRMDHSLRVGSVEDVAAFLWPRTKTIDSADDARAVPLSVDVVLGSLREVRSDPVRDAQMRADAMENIRREQMLTEQLTRWLDHEDA